MCHQSIAGLATRLSKAGLEGQGSSPLAIVGTLATMMRSVGRVATLASIQFALALPSAAEQVDATLAHPSISLSDSGRQQSAMEIAASLNVRRSGCYQRHDLASIASLYTAEATYIELMPVLQVFKGRDQIKSHLEELSGASAVGLVPTVTDADRNPDGTILVAGDYLVLSRETTESVGHFVQSLRWEDGAWRIATHVFARPDPLTTEERYPRD
jgi:ketosteroid isomerase-like protein